MRIAIIDFGSGNLRSVCKATESIAPGATVAITSDPEVIKAADRVIFPGQGAIGTCLRALQAEGLRSALETAISSKPFLGICLGLQALYDYSEEDGGTKCLGVLSGHVELFKPVDGARMATHDSVTQHPLKIPHMGWNNVYQTQDHPLWRDIPSETRFYFVHSYCALANDEREVYGVTNYGARFVSAAGRDNVFAVQFHPEKSQEYGLRLLRNFVEWDGG